MSIESSTGPMVKRKVINITKPRLPLMMAVNIMHHGTTLEASLISSAISESASHPDIRVENNGQLTNMSSTVRTQEGENGTNLANKHGDANSRPAAKIGELGEDFL